MTLLTMCQEVADNVGVDRPTSIVGSNDRAARRLLALANVEGRTLAKKRWSILHVTYEWTTQAGVDTYELPSDFESLVSDTAWDRTNYWNMRGGLTPREWGIRRNAIIARTAVRKMFRVMRAPSGLVRKTFRIDPPMNIADNEQLVFEYKSNAFCADTGGTPQASWTEDGATGILDEGLMTLGLLWRYRKTIGLDYEDDLNEYVLTQESMLAQDGPNRILRPRPARVVIGALNVPEGNYG